MKKVLSLVLALVFVLALAVNAFAATGINVSANPKKVNPGETFVVTVKLENDIPLSEGATMMQGELKYDEEVLDFVSVEIINENLTAEKHSSDAKVLYSWFSPNNRPKEFSKGEFIKATFKVKDTVSSSVHLNTVLKFNAYVQNRAGEDVADITFNKETKILVTAGEHSWNAGEVTTEPTCSKAGVRTFTCTFEGCGATKTEEEPATKNHTPKEAVKENEKAATCKETGSYDEVVYCSVCNGEISRTAVTVPVTNNHSPKEAVKENEKVATCKDDGSYDEVVYCSVCDNEISRTTVTVSATGEHVYEEEVERVEATCDEDGHVIKACGCGAHSEPIVLPKHGHTWGNVEYTWAEDYSSCTAHRKCVCTMEECEAEETRDSANVTPPVTTPATCTEEGKTVYTVAFVDEWAGTATKTVVIEIDEDAHEWDEGKVTAEPNCSKVGEKTFTCKHNAGHTYTEEIEKELDAHEWEVFYNWEEDHSACTAIRSCKNSAEHNLTAEATQIISEVAKPATCSAMGDTRYEAIFEENWAHDYKAVTDIEIDKDAHEWDAGKVTKQPSYTEAGVMTYTCQNTPEGEDEHTKTVEIPVLEVKEEDTYEAEGPDNGKSYRVGIKNGVFEPTSEAVKENYPTASAIVEAFEEKIEECELDTEKGGFAIFEATIGYFDNAGKFVPASEEFFADGRTLKIKLPIPKGADKNDKFVIYHLNSETGKIDEYSTAKTGFYGIEVTNEDLVIEVGSLSPFAIAYESVDNIPSWPFIPGKPSKPSRPSDKPNPGITIITPEDEKEEANPNTGAPVVCSFDLTAAGVVVLAATAAVLEIKRRK